MCRVRKYLLVTVMEIDRGMLSYLLVTVIIEIDRGMLSYLLVTVREIDRGCFRTCL